MRQCSRRIRRRPSLRASRGSAEHGNKRMRNQMFSQMNQAALARLKDRDPREIARNAGVRYDEETLFFHIPTMEMGVTVAELLLEKLML